MKKPKSHHPKGREAARGAANISHRIIISSLAIPPAPSIAAEPASSIAYELIFTPSHDLPETIVNQRIAKARRVLAKLEADLTAPAAGASED
jgi:hypothetical protein